MSRSARNAAARLVDSASPKVRQASRIDRCSTEFLEARSLFSGGGLEAGLTPDSIVYTPQLTPEIELPLLPPVGLPPISPPGIPPIIVDPFFYRDINVTFGGVTVNDNDATPSVAEGTDFGSIGFFDTGPTRTFTITNTGNLSVTLGSIGTTGNFSTPAGPMPTLSPGDSISFPVTMTGAGTGTQNGTVSFTTNVPGENPYNFAVTGFVFGLIVVDPPVFLSPEITVLDGGTSITDGTAADVNFGSVVVGSASPSKTFTVRNDGSLPLTLGAVTVPAGYNLIEGLPASLAAGASDTFTVGLNTGAVGTPSGSISIVNNDSNEGPFNFPILGAVTAAPTPAIEVARGDTTLTDGSSSVSFGSVAAGASAPVRTFTVRNAGTANLTLTAPTLPAGFTLTEPLNATLAPGASDTFTVSLSTAAQGTFNGDLVIANNDATKNPYNFNVTGTITAPGSPPVTPPPAPPVGPPASPPPGVPPVVPPPPGVPPVVGAGNDDGPAAAAAAVTGPLSTNLDGNLLPASVVGGTKTAKGKVTLIVTNTTGSPVNGQLGGSLFASTNGVVDGNDLNIGSLAKNIKLKANQTKSLKVKVVFGPPAADADHNLLAALTFNGADAATAVGNRMVRVEQPRITLTAGSPGAPAFNFGGKANLAIPVTNTGNVPAKGTVNVDLLASSATTPTPFSIASLAGVKVNAKAGAGGTMKLKFTMPASFPAPNVAGAYTMTINLTSSALGAANTTDGTTLTTFPFTIA